METRDLVFLLLGLSTVVEKGLQFFAKPFVDLVVKKENKKIRTPIFNTLATLCGAGLAFAFDLAIIRELGRGGNIYVDKVVTGLLIGGGADFIHPLVSKLVPELANKIQLNNQFLISMRQK